MVRPTLTLLTSGALALMAHACSTSSSSSKKADATAPAATDTGTDTSSTANGTQTPPCTAVATVASASTATDSSSSSSTGTATGSSGLSDFALAAPTFSEIQPTITQYCVTCHKTGANMGATTDFTGQSGWDADASNIVAQLNASLMPLGNAPQPSPADKANLVAYATALTGGAPAGPTPASPAVTPPAAVPCVTPVVPPVSGATATTAASDTSTEIETPASAFLQTLLNPPGLATCHGQGLIYNRGTSVCDTSKINPTCDANWLLTQYGNNAQVKAFIAAHAASNNWIADQCGIDVGGTPVAFFLCIQSTGSSACLDPKTANDPNLTLFVACAGKVPQTNCTTPVAGH